MKKDWLGFRCGRLVVIETLPENKARCKCDCGNETVVFRMNLRPQNTTSCGCVFRKRASDRFKTHGRSKTTEYRSWSQMKNRCQNPNADRWEYYGGRGIKVCERWQKFENFLEDMGPKPGRGYSVERIDNEGDYTPENCKWATRSEQVNNRRSSAINKIKSAGFTLAEFLADDAMVKDVSVKYGISRNTVTSLRRKYETV